MKKFAYIAIGVAMLLAGATFAEESAQDTMKKIKAGVPVLENIPMTMVRPFSNELLRDGRFAAGIYRNDSKRIFIAPMFWSNLKHVMIHEAGHYIWYNEMSDSQRLNYCRIFQNEGKVVSSYAKTDCEENFAEIFAYANGSRHMMYSDLDEYMKNSAQLRIANSVTKDIISRSNR